MGLYRFTSGLDSLGMTTSTLCALHCLLVPLLVMALPFWGLAFLANPWIDKVMIGTALLIGGFSLGLSYFRHHHRLLPLFLFIAGFGLIVFIHLTHAHSEPFPPYSRLPNIISTHAHYHTHGIQEIILLFLGGISIAAAHFLNWRYSRKHHIEQKKKIATNDSFQGSHPDENKGTVPSI